MLGRSRGRNHGIAASHVGDRGIGTAILAAGSVAGESFLSKPIRIVTVVFPVLLIPVPRLEHCQRFAVGQPVAREVLHIDRHDLAQSVFMRAHTSMLRQVSGEHELRPLWQRPRVSGDLQDRMRNHEPGKYRRGGNIVRSANPGPAISFLKIWATETFERLSDLLVELAGEAGSLRGEVDFDGDLIDVPGSYYCVFPGTIAAGTNEIQRNILATLVLNLPHGHG